MIELRGMDGRLLAMLSSDGRRLRIKRRSVLYEIDLVATVARGAAVITTVHTCDVTLAQSLDISALAL